MSRYFSFNRLWRWRLVGGRSIIVETRNNKSKKQWPLLQNWNSIRKSQQQQPSHGTRSRVSCLCNPQLIFPHLPLLLLLLLLLSRLLFLFLLLLLMDNWLSPNFSEGIYTGFSYTELFFCTTNERREEGENKREDRRRSARLANSFFKNVLFSFPRRSVIAKPNTGRLLGPERREKLGKSG